ncbi:MAG: HlyD family efflux transporter periplasmic adaptor subunit [Acidobacteriota bacterium]
MMIRNNKRIPLAIMFVALGCLGLMSCSLWNGTDEDKIQISGNIEFTQVHIAFKSSGMLSDLPIEEGDEVREGTVLARLDMQQQEKQREREQAALSVAKTSLKQHKTGIEYLKASLEAEISSRNAQLRQAQAKLDQLLAGSRAQEIRRAEAAVGQARSEQNFLLVKEGPRKEDIEGARASVEQAKAALQQVEASRLEIKRKEQEIETRQAQIEQARAQVAFMDAVLADGIVRAPMDGVILEKSAELGEVVAAGTTIATLGDMKRPWLRGYIRQQDHGRVKLGMKVRITTDSYPDKFYEGRVSFIASEAEFTPKQIQTPEERVKLVYRIKIEVANPEQELKLNMPASAEILLDSVSD